MQDARERIRISTCKQLGERFPSMHESQLRLLLSELEASVWSEIDQAAKCEIFGSSYGKRAVLTRELLNQKAAWVKAMGHLTLQSTLFVQDVSISVSQMVSELLSLHITPDAPFIKAHAWLQKLVGREHIGADNALKVVDMYWKFKQNIRH